MRTRRQFACLLFPAPVLAAAGLWAPMAARAQAPASPLTPAPAPTSPPASPPPSLPPPPPGAAADPGPPIPMPPPAEPPRPMVAPTSAAAQRNTELPAVAIREFRSSVPELSARGATDMFILALVKSRRFRVLERARLAEGVAFEKGLNQQGQSTGETGRSQFIGATYLFEATISEASSGERSTSFTVGVAGAAAGKGSTSDSIAIDVRVTDVESGVIVDALTVRKEIRSEETKVAGITTALAGLLTRGRASAAAEALAPEDKYISARKDSVDRTLRAAIDEAVADLARRLSPP